jgi:hypothetical protein
MFSTLLCFPKGTKNHHYTTRSWWKHHASRPPPHPHASTHVTNNDGLCWKTDGRPPANSPPTTKPQQRQHSPSTPARGPTKPPTPRPSPQSPLPPSQNQGQVPITEQNFSPLIGFLPPVELKKYITTQWMVHSTPHCASFTIHLQEHLPTINSPQTNIRNQRCDKTSTQLELE